jgi:hypothetical protein
MPRQNAGESRIDRVVVQFKERGHRVSMTMSGDTEVVRRFTDETEVLEGVEVPRSIELTTSGGADPDMYAHVELRDGSPVLTELKWTSKPGQNEIRNKHLRATNIPKLITDLVVSIMPTNDLVPVGEAPDVTAMRQSKAAARRFADRQQQPRARRVMTREFLQDVAKVYRENFDGKPTKAVAETFNVQSRMASKYVDAARKRGYLPPTVRGQKKV